MTVLQLKGGTTAQVAAQTPAAREIVIDTTLKRILIGDGSTAGGSPLTIAPQNGVVDGSDAGNGKIGEIITTTTALASITTNVDTNLASVVLTAGDWDVSAVARFESSASAFTAVFCGLNTTSGTGPGFPNAGQISGLTSGGTQQLPSPTLRFSVTASTTIYLVGRAAFASGTATARGYILARRAR